MSTTTPQQDAAPPSPASTVIRIEQDTATTTPRANRNLIFGLSRPVFGIIAVSALSMTGAASYFLSQFPKVRGLNSQVETLAKEVDELENQIGILEQEVDRLAETVVALGSEVTRLTEANEEAERLVAEFTIENEQLAESNEQLKQSNEELAGNLQVLNETNKELQESVDGLAEQNDIYTGLLTTQNQTIDELNKEVGALENATEVLNSTVMALEVQVDDLETQVATLQATNDELQRNVNNLTDQVSSLTDQNQALQESNDELKELLEYFEESLGNLNQTFEEGVAEINRLVAINTGVVVSNTEQSTLQTWKGWECLFHDSFAGFPFMDDLNLPIGATDYDDVMSEVDRILLDELCLDRPDTEAYLSTLFGLTNPPVTITINQLESGVNSYVDQAMDYYFPPRGGTGLTSDDWVAADSDCQNLPPDKQFFLSVLVA